MKDFDKTMARHAGIAERFADMEASTTRLCDQIAKSLIVGFRHLWWLSERTSPVQT